MNDSLSDPNQGVCAINLHFEHTTVGDLMMFLTSPAGEQILLVGATTAPPPFTDFATWNISFLPCAIPASPDAGFSPQWSNAQSWSAFGSYTGSYHPFSGCLEDFNSGPVNGSWTLFIQDGIEFDEGELLGFSIIFCDPAGIDCETCLPDGGILNALPIQICQGSTLDEFPDPIYLFGDPPPEDEYLYNFLLTQDDTVVAVLPDSNYIFNRADSFRLYGISLLKSDSTTLDSLVGEMSISELIVALDPNPGLFCGDMAMRWVDLIVHPTYEYNLDSTICFNGFIALGDTVITDPGIHSIILQTNSGCDSTVHINLSIDSSLIAIGHALDTFTCHVDSVTLDASQSVLTPNAQWYWENPNGNIVGDSNSISVKAGYPGVYSLIVYDQQCTVVQEVEVYGHLNGVPVEIIGSDLGCALDTSDFTLESYESLISFEWIDPAGVLRMDSIVKITEPGWLFFNAVDTNSCAVSDSVFVNKDLTGPNILSDSILGTCEGDTIYLSPVPNDSSWQLVWIFEGDTLSGPNPSVNFSGIFELIVTDTLGCISRDSIFAGYINPEPTVNLATAPLGCNESSVPILASTGIGGSQYYWQGPNSFEDFVQGIDAPLPGDYFLTVTTPEGCTADTVITVVSEGDLPDWEINLSDTTGCLLDSVQILLNVGYPNMTFEWTGPGAFYSELQSPFVSVEGWYRVDMTTRGGCSITDSIRVRNDFDVGDIFIYSDTLNCLQPEGYIWVDGPEGYTYRWTVGAADPVESDSVLFNQSKLHTLQVIDPDNGCSVFFEHLTEADFDLPTATLSADTINCNATDAFIYIESGQYAEFWHSSPFVTAEVDSGVWVDRPGDYFLYFEGDNGCIDSFQIEVVADTLGPDLSILGEDLGCGRDSVVLSFETSANLEEFEWNGPSGFTSSDSIVVVYNAGEYTLFVEGTNGCTSENLLVIEDNSEFIEINFSPALELNCNQSTVPVSIENPLDEYEYNWKGPGGFASADDTLSVTVPGWYHLTVTDNSNCTGIDSIEIIEDFELPEIEIMYSDFSCIDTVVVMQAIGLEEYVFQWTGPEGFSSDSSAVLIQQPGEYFL
nr:proprotein convertase P-domain-containing protein [Saprospiraceae bacterium]